MPFRGNCHSFDFSTLKALTNTGAVYGLFKTDLPFRRNPRFEWCCTDLPSGAANRNHFPAGQSRSVPLYGSSAAPTPRDTFCVRKEFLDRHAEIVEDTAIASRSSLFILGTSPNIRRRRVTVSVAETKELFCHLQSPGKPTFPWAKFSGAHQRRCIPRFTYFG
jgi:hypothetical protein